MKQNSRGFTLIELTVAIVVISIGLTGLISGVRQLYVDSADPMLRTQAMSLARSYMQEIVAKEVAGGGNCAANPTRPGNRLNWEVCHYNNLTNDPPRDIYNNLINAVDVRRGRACQKSDGLPELFGFAKTAGRNDRFLFGNNIIFAFAKLG